MKIIKCSYNTNEYYGVLQDNKIFISEENPYLVKDFSSTIDFSTPLEIKEVKLLLPYAPSKIIGVAINYTSASGTSRNMREPLVFLKGLNALTFNHKKIKVPFGLKCWGEVELAIVISQQCKSINEEQSFHYILGYSVANDMTVENIDNRDHHLARSKSVDNFCPILEYIDTDFVPKNQLLQSFHNDKLLREGRLDEMIWSVNKIVSEISQWMTLEKGDIILTGTPSRVGPRQFLQHGDSYRCEIEGLNKLENKFYE